MEYFDNIILANLSSKEVDSEFKTTTIMVTILWPKQKFFFLYPNVFPLAQLLNAREVRNAGANPQPYNIKNKGGVDNWLFFIYLVTNWVFLATYFWYDCLDF